MKVLLFKVHAGDPLSSVITDVTRTAYTHAALLVDELANQICEAYLPHVRYRTLEDSELAGIDAFDIAGLTGEQAAGIMGYCAEAVAAEEPYSVENLCRFSALLRKLIGEAQDVSVHSPVICSQFVFDALERGAGIRLLNAPSYEIAPGYLAWSPLLRPAAPLRPLRGGALGAVDEAFTAARGARALPCSSREGALGAADGASATARGARALPGNGTRPPFPLTPANAPLVGKS